MKNQVRLCHAQEIADGTSRGFDPEASGRDTLFVVRSGDSLCAWRNVCPHWEGTSMAWRKDEYLSADRRHIVCAAHGAQFDIFSGVCTLGPCLGESLIPISLTFDVDQNMYAAIDNI